MSSIPAKLLLAFVTCCLCLLAICVALVLSDTSTLNNCRSCSSRHTGKGKRLIRGVAFWIGASLYLVATGISISAITKPGSIAEQLDITMTEYVSTT